MYKFYLSFESQFPFKLFSFYYQISTIREPDFMSALKERSERICVFPIIPNKL